MSDWVDIHAELAGLAAPAVLDRVTANPSKLLATQIFPEMRVTQKFGPLNLQKVRRQVLEDVERSTGSAAKESQTEFVLGPNYNCTGRTSREKIPNEEQMP